MLPDGHELSSFRAAEPRRLVHRAIGSAAARRA
jgi:hypothetical protein